MKQIIRLIALSIFFISCNAQAQTSFMELWCEYGGKGCTQTPKPQQAPVTPAQPAYQKPSAPIVHSTPLISKKAAPLQSKGVSFGRYFALVIGNNAYPHLENLKTAINDAKAVGKLLEGSYGFSVNLLINANRDQIITTLDEYRKQLHEDDNLLIYYAGHGWLDKESERGYWLPVDADQQSRARWLSNADITDTLKALKARHVLVVADSCYAGTLTRSALALDQTRGLKLNERPQGYLQTVLSRKSRTVMASGALEPVSDQGGGKHSVFAHAFLKKLQENNKLMDATELYAGVRQQVLLNARQTPQYSDIRFAGHDVGGDFIFLRRDK